MNFQKSLLSCFILSSACGVSVSNAQTLQEAVQLTINDNPEIQEAKSLRLANEQEIDQAAYKYLPSLDVAAGYGIDQTNSPVTRSTGVGTRPLARTESSVQLQQMVFDGFATPHEVSRLTAKTDAQAYTVFGQSEIIGLQATQAYINVLRRQALYKLADDNLKSHQGIFEQIKLRTQRGIGRKSDLDQATGRLARAESNLKAEAGNLKDAETNFLRQIGELPHNLKEAPKPTQALPGSMEEATELALANHPTLKSANADIVESLAQHNTASAPFYPNVNLVVNYSDNSNTGGVKSYTEGLTAMARVTYNLFNGGKDAARRNQTAYEVNQAKNIRDRTYRQVVESMRLSWVAYKTLGSQLEFFKAHYDASTKTLDAYKKQFNIGQRTLLDLLDTTNEMYTASVAYTDAKYTELAARYRILAGMGRLNKYLEVSLPKESKPITADKNEDNVIITATNDNPTVVSDVPENTGMEALEKASEATIQTAALPESTLNAEDTLAVGPIPVAAPNTASSSDASMDESEVNQRLRSWAAAWSQGDFNNYVDYYLPDFKPDISTSHEAWKKARQSRVKRGNGISVNLSQVKTQIDKGNNTATTTFKQAYKSKNFQDNSNKKIVWQKVNNQWLISEEKSSE